MIDRRFPKRRRPFACSFDLRMGDSKTFVVDANFFPSGWHHFPFPDKSNWTHHQAQVKTFFKWTGEESIAIVPEHHIQNEDYLKNLAWLHNFFECCGLRTYVMPITEDGPIKEKMVFEKILGPCQQKPISYVPYVCSKENGRHVLKVDGYPMDFALSQYDGSKNELKLSKKLDLPFYPPHFCSWQHRRKHEYFDAYHQFVKDVVKELGVDLDSYRFKYDAFTVKNDLKQTSSPMERAAYAVTEHWDRVVSWVKDHSDSVNEDYFWMLKSDHGTYGLGVEPVTKNDPIEDWPVRRIKRFRHGRHNMPVMGLVLQEGLASTLKIEGKVGERVDYYFLGEKYGDFYRIHEKKSEFENLNRPGVDYQMEAPGLKPDDQTRLDIASLLAFGGVCLEYERILKAEGRFVPERDHIA
jgi:glutamate--cysteine ligase